MSLGLDYYLKSARYSRAQKFELVMGYLQGVDVTLMDNPHYCPDQMAELREGLVMGLNIASYANVELSATEMKERRYALEREILAQFTPEDIASHITIYEKAQQLKHKHETAN